MSSVVIAGNTSGTVTLLAPDIAGTTTLTLPTTSGTIVTTAEASALTTSGNLTFTGTGNRITGDMSNATVANRVAFQTSTTNGGTSAFVLPNGTGTFSAWNMAAQSDPANASFISILTSADVSECRINSNRSGTGTYYPLTMYTGGSERLRIDTSGNVGIGTSSPQTKLDFGPVANNTQIISVRQNGNNRAGLGVNSDYGLRVTGPSDATATISFGSISVSDGSTFTERMRIDSSGNVGIGTSSPSYRLDTRASAGVGIQFLETSSGSTNRIQLGAGSGLGYINVDAGSGSIALAMQVAGSERMRIDSSGNLLFNSGYGSVATAYGCRAWVNFNGQGTVAIRASGNVSSITDNGAGKYVANFSTSMPDANYSANASCSKDNDIDDGAMRISIGNNTTNIPIASACPITITRGDGTAVDPARVYLSIFR